MGIFDKSRDKLDIISFCIALFLLGMITGLIVYPYIQGL